MNAPYMTRPGRPVGVTILTILQIFSGIGDLFFGALLLILAVLAGVLVGGALATALFLLDFVVIGLGIFSFALAYGLWTGKRWAWTLSVIGAIIGIVLGALIVALSLVAGSGILESLAILVPIALYVLILAYLSTRNVRAFFGRLGGVALVRPAVPAPVGQPYMPPTPPTQPPYPQPSAQQPYYPQPETFPQPATWGPIACANCGAPNQPGTNFCDRCGTRLR
ncbi:MAG: zinc-ribbon domain-containing protein [Candidatus Bathyarchaeia archaeon]